MDGDFIPQCGGHEARATAFMLYQEAEYWKARALLAENSPSGGAHDASALGGGTADE